MSFLLGYFGVWQDTMFCVGSLSHTSATVVTVTSVFTVSEQVPLKVLLSTFKSGLIIYVVMQTKWVGTDLKWQNTTDEKSKMIRWIKERKKQRGKLQETVLITFSILQLIWLWARTQGPQIAWWWQNELSSNHRAPSHCYRVALFERRRLPRPMSDNVFLSNDSSERRRATRLDAKEEEEEEEHPEAGHSKASQHIPVDQRTVRLTVSKQSWFMILLCCWWYIWLIRRWLNV